MSEVTCIGRCRGCDRMRRLDDGVCTECLSPSRGRAWAENMHRCRTDHEFARTTYDSIRSENGKKIFRLMFPQLVGTVICAPPVPTGTGRPT